MIEGEDEFEISFKPRPAVELVKDEAITLVDGVYRHRGFCHGQEDQVSIQFNGGSVLDFY